MPRTGRVRKRAIKADEVFRSVLVSRFVNRLMQRGKKTGAEKIFYSALSLLSEDKPKSFEIFKRALENVTPRLEVRSRRIGGATYQVPTPVRRERSEALAIRWLIGSARAKKGRPMNIKLSEEIKEASEGIGSAVKRRETAHRMAEANKAFAHFKW